MRDDFSIGASWGAMRAEILATPVENHVPGDFTLDILDAVLDAIEQAPAEQRDALVRVALGAWSDASDRYENRT